MMSPDLDEVSAGRLARLPILGSDPRRAERTRRRCRDLLGRKRRRREPVRSRAELVQRGLQVVAAGAFCVIYVAYVGALVATTLRFEGPLY